jgi:hypothetical protein
MQAAASGIYCGSFIRMIRVFIKQNIKPVEFMFHNGKQVYETGMRTAFKFLIIA